MGQVAYLTVALLATSAHMLMMLRWRKDTKSGVSYYNTWKTYESVLGTDYTKLADQIMGYGGLTIWGVTSITQIISFFALQDINLKIWMYLVTYGTLIVGVMYNVFMLLAINKASGLASDTTK